MLHEGFPVAPVRLRLDVHHPFSPLPVPGLSDVLARQGLAWPTPLPNPPASRLPDSRLNP